MTDINIPPEAVEAAARAICDLTGNDPQNWMYWNREATAAIRAALAAWPGMETLEWALGADLILPIPQDVP